MSENELRFDGQVAIITGAGRGMGRAHARLLAARGAKVVVNDIDPQPAQEVVDEITAEGGTALVGVADIVNKSEVFDLVARTVDEYGRVDILVNNAALIEFSLFEDMTPELFDRSMKVNAWGPMFTAQAVWPHFVGQGYGRVVMVCSAAALFAFPDRVAYSASKSAMIGMSRTLASDGDDKNINVNVLFPSAITRGSSLPQKKRYADRFNISQDVLEEKTPGLVSPMVAWLSHADCPANGEILEGGEGYFRRIVTGATRGFDRPVLDLTPETVRDNWSDIMDLSTFEIRPSYRTRAQWSTADKVPQPGAAGA